MGSTIGPTAATTDALVGRVVRPMMGHLLHLIIVLVLVPTTAHGNTPPTVSMSRDWMVQESEELGSVVTRITSHDSDGDDITYMIDRSSIGEDGSHFFEIDQDGIVRIANSLEGMRNKNLYVSVVATDGQFTTRTDARVVVGTSKEKPTHSSGLFAALNPGHQGVLLPRIRDRIADRASNLAPFLHVNRQDSHGSPPLLTLKTHTVWVVPSTAAVNTAVADVDAMDTSGESYFFTLQDQLGLIAIDPQTGEITVKKSLLNQVGNHKVLVEVTNRYGTADGEAMLQVLRATPPVTHDTPNTDLVSATTTARSDTRPTLIAIVKNGPTASSSTLAPDSSSSGPSETTDDNLSVWMVVVIALVSASSVVCGPIVYCCCYRKIKNKSIDRKESSVKYDKKGLELTPVSSAANSLNREQAPPQSLPQILRFWQRRASENSYEDSGQQKINVVAIPSRPTLSIKDTSYSVSSEPTDEWEFPRHKLKVLSILGEGCFGQVWKYEAQDLNGAGSGKTFVAVKTLKESAGQQERKDLQQELKVLKNLGNHPNVVSLLACCTEKEPTLLVLEYLIHGKLLTYLRDRRSKQPYNNLHGSSSSLSPRDLTIFALQVAKGMEYLSVHGIVHRDLAARNVLVGEDKICKVADFGFARDVANNHIYERKSNGRLPIRWMAVESLFDNIFASKTDVWSFGILLWEIVTLGSTPYPGMLAEEVMKKIKEGYRLEKPDYCKREVYNIMYYCWYENPMERPTFRELIKLLEGLITSEVDYIELNKFPERSYYNITISPSSGERL